MTVFDARAALQAVAEPIAEALSGEYLAVTIDLHPVLPLPDRYPPQTPLMSLAQRVAAPVTVTAVQQIKPVRHWIHALRKSLQCLDSAASEPTGFASTNPRNLNAEARTIAQTIEWQLATVRIAATITLAPDAYLACVHEHYLLVTKSHLALLALRADD